MKVIAGLKQELRVLVNNAGNGNITLPAHQIREILDEFDFLDQRAISLGRLLQVDLPDTAWPEEVSLVLSQLGNLDKVSERHKMQLKYHINRMFLEKMEVPSIITAAHSLIGVMEEWA